MRESLFETIVGFAVVAIAGLFLAFSLTQRGEAAPRNSFEMTAVFTSSVMGVSPGTDVRVNGVKVGVVKDIKLDPDPSRNLAARVTFTIPRTVSAAGKESPFELPYGTSVQVRSEGLLGGSYLNLSLSSEPDYDGNYRNLKPGEEILNTQGSIDLLTSLTSALSGITNDSAESSTEGSAD